MSVITPTHHAAAEASSPGGEATTLHLDRPGGRVSYDVAGEGPLILLVPGMGDLRSSYRLLAPLLRAAGHRVACTDLRGHGDSDATFGSYGDAESAGDIIALLEQLGAPAIVAGNSMGAGAAALAAAERPDLISGLVLIGPFVREPASGALTRVMLRLAMARPWAARAWGAYMPKMYAGSVPGDFKEYRSGVMASMRLPGHARAFSLTTRTRHTVVQERLGEVRAPALILMGELDPDFPDPVEEAEWIAGALSAQTVMVSEAGHYPQSQQPQVCAEAILRFAGSGSADA
jgi:pimeloyl-ACP methyl ester carboxylesterase